MYPHDWRQLIALIGTTYFTAKKGYRKGSFALFTRHEPV